MFTDWPAECQLKSENWRERASALFRHKALIPEAWTNETAIKLLDHPKVREARWSLIRPRACPKMSADSFADILLTLAHNINNLPQDRPRSDPEKVLQAWRYLSQHAPDLLRPGVNPSPRLETRGRPSGASDIETRVAFTLAMEFESYTGSRRWEAVSLLIRAAFPGGKGLTARALIARFQRAKKAQEENPELIIFTYPLK